MVSGRSWFRQLEAEFAIVGIQSQSTKYACDIDVEEDDNVSIKTAALDVFRANHRLRIEEALVTLELVTKRPSQLVTSMRRKFADQRCDSQVAYTAVRPAGHAQPIAGKQPVKLIGHAPLPGHDPKQATLLFLHCKLFEFSVLFLVDTGAERSLRERPRSSH
jgi:hypothetical protein